MYSASYPATALTGIFNSPSCRSTKTDYQCN